MARFAFDENGSPYYVDGYRTYLRSSVPIHWVRYDSDGFRVSDVERTRTGTTVVGVFGDSYTEGLQVEEEQAFPRWLETRLNDRSGKEIWHVWNFGVGGTGTYQQLLRYRTVREHIDLDWVVVAFLPLNDVLDNHPELGRDFTLPTARIMHPDGREEPLSAAPPLSSDSPTVLVRRFLRSTFLGVAVFEAYSNWVARNLYGPGGSRQAWLGVYEPPNTEQWREAWAITEQSLLAFEREAVQAGSQFLLVLLTDSLQINPPADLLSGFSLDYPNRRLSAFAENNGILFLDTYAAFLGNKPNLTPPYYSWPSDGHYSEAGTDLVSALLTDFFESEKLAN